MGTAKTIISVALLGDAKNLIGALGKADAATGGLLKSAAKVAIAGGLVKKGFGSLDNALDNADTFSDALDDIAGTMTPEFAAHIRDISDDFTNIGLSSPEVATMAASFANLATAAKVSQPLIADITPDLLTIAAAIAATQGRTVDEVINDIGLAAGGNQKTVKDYGLVLDKALSPDAQILSILEQLKAKFPDAITATNDLAGAQDKLDAKWDTFTTNVGLAVEGPLTDVVDWFVDVSELIPSAIAGFGLLGDRIVSDMKKVLEPLARVLDVINNINSAVNNVRGNPGFDQNDINSSPRRRESSTVQDMQNYRERNGAVRERIGGV